MEDNPDVLKFIKKLETHFKDNYPEGRISSAPETSKSFYFYLENKLSVKFNLNAGKDRAVVFFVLYKDNATYNITYYLHTDTGHYKAYNNPFTAKEKDLEDLTEKIIQDVRYFGVSNAMDFIFRA